MTAGHTVTPKALAYEVARLAPENVPYLTIQQAEALLEVTAELITFYLQSGKGVRLSGLGTFRLHTRAPRRCRNLRTGEAIDVPARKAVVCRPTARLKRRIEGRP